MTSSLLSILIWLPIVGGAAVSLIGSERASTARWVALGVSLLTFIINIPLFTGYDAGAGTMQFVENHAWIAAIQTWLSWNCMVPAAAS